MYEYTLEKKLIFNWGKGFQEHFIGDVKLFEANFFQNFPKISLLI